MITDEQKRLILDWTKKVHILEYAHRFESKRHEKRNLYFGIPPIILGALITIQLLNSYSTIITSIGGVIIAILAGLQTFLRPSELAEKHRRISETYEKIRNKFEYLLIYNSQNPQTFKKKLEAVKAEWDNLETLNVPKKIYLEAKGQVRKINIYPEQLSHLHISNDV